MEKIETELLLALLFSFALLAQLPPFILIGAVGILGFLIPLVVLSKEGQK